MNQTFLIARRDLRSYFYTPQAYLVAAVFLGVTNYVFYGRLARFADIVGRYGSFNFPNKPTLTGEVVLPTFGMMNLLLLFVTPFLTMRLFAEEKRDHTIELLLCAPVRQIEIVLGKFLAGLGLVAFLLGLTVISLGGLGLIARPDWGVITSGYLGVFLIAATYVGIGLFYSSRTENQIVAAVLTFVTTFFFWLISWSAETAGTFWAEVFSYVALVGHFNNAAQGIVSTTDLVYYFSVTGFTLFLTNLSLES